MKITNTTQGDIGLSPDAAHLVPAGGSIEISQDDLELLKKSAPNKAHFDEKRLIEDRPKAKEPSEKKPAKSKASK